MLAIKTFAHRIERARADIAINNPEAGETEQNEPVPATFGSWHGRRNAGRVSERRELKLAAQNSPVLKKV